MMTKVKNNFEHWQVDDYVLNSNCRSKCQVYLLDFIQWRQCIQIKIGCIVTNGSWFFR